MYLLDTDTLTHLYFGNQNVVEHLHNTHDPDIGTTLITKIELLRGRFDFVLKAANGAELAMAQQLLDKTEELLSQILVVPFSLNALNTFDRLRAEKGLRKVGR